jgi:ABC-type transport system involved in multi-copper enzyme maturation permease subunit
VNKTTARALLEDAFQQVLDNKIFRLLLIVVFGIVAAFFLVGFREDGVHLLYGWRTIEYADIFGFFGASARGVSDPQGQVIGFVESLVVESLAGDIAMVFCISATAFFVPRMLEKGAADTLFSKPVSRATLLLSRYASGLVFVTILATVLLSGIWLGLLVVSGWNDPGLLWGILTLVYLYGILHAFSTCIGVLTRSTVAAILLSLLFFMGTGCIHGGWKLLEYNRETKLLQRAHQEAARLESGDEDPAPQAAGRSGADEVVEAIAGVVDPLHYVLPKTSDADILTKRVRRAIAGGPVNLVDEEGKLTVVRALDGLELRSPTVAKTSENTIPADLDSEAAVWEDVADDGHVRARIEIRRGPRVPDAAANGRETGARKPRRLSSSAVADLVVERIEASGRAVGEPVRRKGAVGDASAALVLWKEADASPLPMHQSAVLTFGDWWYEIALEAEPEWAGTDFEGRRPTQFLQRIRIGGDMTAFDPSAWYEKQFGWTSRWRYNAFVSIGSSLLFVLVVLGIACWRLARIDL